MLLSITMTGSRANDLSWLLHKHPDKVQAYSLSCGRAIVGYSEATPQRCTAHLLLDVDPIGLVRNRLGPAGDRFALEQYVNDRPYVASSFLSVAIAQVFGSALGGRCALRPELVEEALPLEARIAVLPCRGGEELLRRLFEPLGYAVEATNAALDPNFREWGASNYFDVTLRGTMRLCDLLSHLYVLIPVLDNDKHYWVGEAEVEKLLAHGAGWLATHPQREQITARFLKHQRGLAREALARLAEDDEGDPDAEAVLREEEEAALEARIAVPSTMLAETPGNRPDAQTEGTDAGAEPARVTDEADAESPGDEPRTPSLHALRLNIVLGALRAANASSVVDLGCGEGRLLRLLLQDRRFARIVGMDVSQRGLLIAAERLRLERMPRLQRARIELIHGSLLYRDARLAGFDAAACVEVVEHLDAPRLATFERVVFEFARPRVVVLTTPNREYNVMWPSLPAGQFRHRDHRFEWTRAEFAAWTQRIAARFGYAPRVLPVGPVDANVGAPTQMAIFERGGTADE